MSALITSPPIRLCRLIKINKSMIWIIVLLGSMVQFGCTSATGLGVNILSGNTAPPAFARLENVLAGDRLAVSPTEIHEVRVIRQGGLLDTRINMALQKGDDIQTGPQATAVISFNEGARVILGANSSIRILNPSLKEFFGKLFVFGLFRVETEYAAAGAEGTEFYVTVDRNNEVSVIVFAGVIRLTSNTQRWEPVLLNQFQQGIVRGQEQPAVRMANRDQFNEIQQWVDRVEQLIQSQVPDTGFKSRFPVLRPHRGDRGPSGNNRSPRMPSHGKEPS